MEQLDIRSKLALQLGNLLLANVELGHQLEGAQAQLAAAQADLAQSKHDAAADAPVAPGA